MKNPEPVSDMRPSRLGVCQYHQIHETASLPGGIYSRYSTDSYSIEAGFSRHCRNEHSHSDILFVCVVMFANESASFLSAY